MALPVAESKRMKMPCLCLLLTLSLCLGLREKTAAQKQVFSQSVVQLRVDDFSHHFNAPIKQLAAAVYQNQKARFFRVSWEATWFGWGSSQTALYDRRMKTVKFFSSGGEQAGSMIHEHYLFTGVTDIVLQRQARDLSKYGDYMDNGTSEAFFDELPKYGCVRHTYLDNKTVP